MKAYLLSVAGVVLIVAALSVIMPSGKMGNFVRGMGKLFVLITLLTPFFSLVGGKTPAFVAQTEFDFQADGGYLTRCAQLLEERDEEEISAYLLQNYNAAGEVKVTRAKESGFSRLQITVNFVDCGIIGQDGHIDSMEQVQKELQQRYGCEVVIA